MAATCENFEKNVLNWMLRTIKQGRSIGFANISDLLQKLGFSTSINESSMSVWKDDQESHSSASNTSFEKNLTSEDLLNVIIQALQTKGAEATDNELPAVKDIPSAPVSPTLKSPKIFSPPKDHDISVQLPTSSPINQNNIIASKLRKIMSLTKETYSMTMSSNTSVGKVPFNHRRLSDIKISPLAEITNASNELNLTKCIEAPSTGKLTPKRTSATKPDVKNETYSAKKSLLQPVKSKLQSFQSKLRTPTSAKSISTSSITRSAGHSRLSAPKSERRLSSTPNGTQKAPGGVSRFAYSQFKHTVK